jgi:hypothetical protein
VNERVSSRLALAASRDQYMVYLGSFPSLIPTEDEFHRELDIDRKATRRRLMLYVDHDRKAGRRFVYVQHGRIGESIDYRPDVSDLVFGELQKGGSEGFVCTERPLMFPNWDYCPMPLIDFPSEKRLPEGSDSIVASTPCIICEKAIGTGNIYYEAALIGGWYRATSGKYIHRECVAEDIDASLKELQEMKPVWKPTKELPKPKQRVAA